MQNADPPLGVTSQRREKRPNPGDPAHGEGGGGAWGGHPISSDQAGPMKVADADCNSSVLISINLVI